MLFDCPRLTVVDFTPWDFSQLSVFGGFIFALKDTPLDIPSYDSLLLRLDEAGISGAYPIDANLCFCTDGLLNVNRVSLVGKGFIIDDGHTP
jgi:hypothetical protein